MLIIFKYWKELALAILLIAGLCYYRVTSYRIQKLTKENMELYYNNTVLEDGLSVYLLNDSARVVQVGQLNKDITELTSKQKELISELNISKRRITELTSIQVKTDTVLIPQYKDGIISYEDKNLKIEAIPSSIRLHLNDTLDIVAFRVPKKFLFIKYGTKGVALKIKNVNPHIKINYAKSINFTK